MPSQEAINDFAAFSGCADSDLAARFIDDANGDLNQAVSNYFDNPGKFNNVGSQWSNGYDEAAFSADRYGDTQASTIPSFSIHAPDDTGFSYTHSSAPTRPPSRAATVGMQESGTIDATGQFFGPATKEYYERDQWALTTTAGTATEIWPDVEAPRRKRFDSDPAFLKPSTAADLLPGLLTVLHTHPAAREFLLCREDVATDYGEDPNWWSGTPIRLPVVYDAEAEDREQQVVRIQKSEFIHEVQRLMAALSFSTRTYLSVDALTATYQMTHQDFPGAEIKTQTAHFMANFTDVAEDILKNRQAQRLFQTIICQAEDDRATDINPFVQFDIPVANLKEGPSSLYDSIDEAFWGSDTDGTAQEQVWIEAPANMLVFLMRQEQRRTLDLDVPLKLYLDRYLKKNIAVMKEVRQQRAECNNQLRDLYTRSNKLRNFRPPEQGKSHEAADLLGAAVQLLRGEGRDGTVDAEGDVSMHSSQPDKEEDSALLAMLKKLSLRVEGQLDALQKEREQTLAKLDELSSMLKTFPSPSDTTSSASGPEAAYSLRGVVTDPSTTYFRFPSPSQPGTNSWCNVSYFSNPDFRLDERTDEEVLNAVRSETGRTALLVYARDDLEAPSGDVELPGPLKTFIARDNALFAAELAEYESTAPIADTSPTDPFTNYTPADPPPYFPGPPRQEEGGFVPDPGEDVISSEGYAALQRGKEVFDAPARRFSEADATGVAAGDRLNPGVSW